MLISFMAIIASFLPFQIQAFNLFNSTSVFESEVACQRPGFVGSRGTKTLSGAADTVVADFNGDGRMDIASHNNSLFVLTVQLNLGNGLFGEPRIVDPNATAFSYIAGDFNNDGFADILSPAKILFGDGNGNFSEPRLLNLGTSVSRVVPGDFNGDDNLDFAAIISPFGPMIVFYGDGFANFPTSTQIALSGNPDFYEVNDFNNDRISDIAITVDNVNKIAVATGTESGTFQTVEIQITGGGEVSYISTGDINSDGKVDIVSSNAGFGKETFIVPLLNNGNGTFTQQPRLTDDYNFVQRLKVADTNLDGAMDIIFVSAPTGTLVMHRGNNNGTFQPTTYTSGIPGTNKIYYEDFTNDGLPDIGLNSASADLFMVLINDGAGNFGSQQIEIGDYAPVAIAAADFNSDGRNDIVTGEESLHLKISLRNAGGGLNAPSSISITRTPRYILTGDMNGDNKPDIIALLQNISEQTGTAAVYISNGNGTFQPPVESVIPDLRGTRQPALVFDTNDTVPDLVIPTPNNQRTLIYAGYLGGPFLFRSTLVINSLSRAVTSGDFNQDGKGDIAVLATGNVLIFLGDGNGNHDFIGYFPSGSADYGIHAADLNNDGMLDLTTTQETTSPGTNPGKVYILLGAGKGGFGAPRQLSGVGRGPSAMGSADFDGDGNLDLAVASPGQTNPNYGPDSRVSVFYGDGLGTFPRIAQLAAASSPRGMVVEDFNGDSLPDILTADYTIGNLSLIKNTCLPQPALFPSLSFAGNVSGTEGDAADVNVNVTVNLSAASAIPVTVNYYTAPQNGLSQQRPEEMSRIQGGKDYRKAYGTLKFLPGETFKTIQLSIRGDLIDEFDEKFLVYLINATNASLGDYNAEVTIVDNDAPPVITIGNFSSAEGNSGNTVFNLPVTLSPASEKPVNVQYLTGGGTAVSGQDYVRAEGMFSLSAGQTAGTIPVSVIGDLMVETNETFLVEINEPVNATIGNNRGTGTIVNDDVGGNIQFSSATYTVNEVAGSVSINITRANGNGGGVSVRFRTQAGTATPGQDYTEVTTVVNFDVNETSKSVSVPITFDQLDEDDEAVNLILDTPVNATLGTPSTAVLTIQDFDNMPDLTISNAAVVEGDNNVTNLLFYARLSRPTQRVVTVNFATANGTATAGVDYAATSGTFSIPRGVTRKAIVVPVYGDFQFEPDETVQLNLSNAVNANLLNNQATGTIINDEITPGASLSLASMRFDGAGSGNSDSYEPSISADGKVVAFESLASNLFANDQNAAMDIFVRYPRSSETELVSVTLDGTTTGSCRSELPLLSANGRFVAFTSCANNLVSNPPAVPTGAVYLRDLQLNQTNIVSVKSNGTAANGEVQAISPDGRFIVYQSRDTDITSTPDTPGTVDVFVRDMQASASHLVSINASGTATANQPSGNENNLQENVKITPDGRYVLFSSTATDIVSQTQAGSYNLYRRDLQTNTTAAATVNVNGTQLIGNDPNGSISADGRYVSFSSGYSGFPNDTNSASDIFRRDMQMNTTAIVSVNTGGVNSATGISTNSRMSSDGRYVAFESSAGNLSVTPDTNAVFDVYLRDMQNNLTRLVSVNAAGTNGGNNYSLVRGLSADGLTVLFATAAFDLVPGGDNNGSIVDLYMRDTANGVTKIVSINEGGTATGNSITQYGEISGDGYSAAFASGASNLVANDINGAGVDIFVYNRKLQRLPLTDFDGDGRTDLSVFRPSNRVWYIKHSGDGSIRNDLFGFATDLQTANDYDGDGKTDIAIYRDGAWYITFSSNNTLGLINNGQAGDIPVPGDYDGDHRADAAVFRPSNGTWYIKESSDGNVRIQPFGISTDVPAAADFDGDLRTDLAVYRDGIWYIFQSATFTVRIEQFGIAADRPVAGDFDGDGSADLAIWRPSNGVWYYRRSSDNGVFAAQFGLTGDTPLKGDFDGDGKADVSIFREGVWYIWKSSDNNYHVEAFGTTGDLPIPR